MAAVPAFALKTGDVSVSGTKLTLAAGPAAFVDFQTPPHLIEAVHRAMKDNKNGYAPSPGIREAIDSIRAEAAGLDRDGGHLDTGGVVRLVNHT